MIEIYRNLRLIAMAYGVANRAVLKHYAFAQMNREEGQMFPTVDCHSAFQWKLRGSAISVAVVLDCPFTFIPCKICFVHFFFCFNCSLVHSGCHAGLPQWAQGRDRSCRAAVAAHAAGQECSGTATERFVETLSATMIMLHAILFQWEFES